jgi:ABC-type sugar transport system, permease component
MAAIDRGLRFLDDDLPPARRGPLGRFGRPRPGVAKRAGHSFVLTFVAVVLVAAFLSPLLRSFTISLKNPDQINQLNGSVYPASPVTYNYQGRDFDVYQVPLDGQTRELALVKKGRTSSDFIDPADPGAGTVTWQGSWRTLQPSYTFDPQWQNYVNVWNELEYPRLLFNTVAIALIGMIGTLVSCVLVAYGFARFRFPGQDKLFILVIATIFLPSAVTLIPTYTIFVKLGWVGTWLPLLVPAFFANAYDVFLLRQYFLTIPREMDEAAAIDGAGPFRTLWSVLLPQAWPVLIAVAIFHIVYSWNDFFGPLIYLSSSPDLQTLAVGLARFSGARVSQDPGLIQAGTILTLIIPVVLFVIFQRVFVRGIVITGVEK